MKSFNFKFCIGQNDKANKLVQLSEKLCRNRYLKMVCLEIVIFSNGAPYSYWLQTLACALIV